MSTTIDVKQKVKAASEQLSGELRAFFAERNLCVLNLIGSPGAGKTSLLESLAPRLAGKTAVIEGDLQTDKDRIRIEKAGLPAYQINTLGACHLDAKMIQKALSEFPLEGVKFLFIENVGNLVCPASFDIGEDMKVAIISVTEGDDKPAKYPSALRKASALIITKTDLSPYVNCDVNRMVDDAMEINPNLRVFITSTKDPQSIAQVADWLDTLTKG